MNETVRVYDLFPEESAEKIVGILELKAKTLCDMNDYETAASVYEECIERLSSLELNENGDGSSNGSAEVCNEQIARLNHKLGLMFAKLGELEEAFESYRRAIQIFTSVGGKNDIRIGEVMYDVGHLLVDQGGDDSQTLGCFSEVIRIYGLQGKEKDVKVADALFQKCALLADRDEYDEATSLLDEAMGIYKELLGNDAIEVGKVMLLYGRLYDAQDERDDAMTAFNEALRIFQLSPEEQDINMSLALSNIGIIHARKLEYTEAVEKCKMALKIRVMRGDQDQDVADSVFYLANILNDMGNEDEAYQYFQQSLKLYRNILGEDNIPVANCQQKLGVVYWNRRDIDRSLQSFLNALRTCEKEQEDDVASILVSVYRGIGDCYYHTGHYSEALEHFAKCIRMMQRTDCDEIEMAEPYYFIGLIYQKTEQYDEAIHSHSKALEIMKDQHGAVRDIEAASPDFQIAKVLLATHKYDECIARFLDHLEAYYEGTADSDEVADVYHPLGLAQGKLGKYRESASSLKKGKYCVLALRVWS